VKRKTSECPYCGSTFEPAFHAPTKDQTWGHWEVFCSQVCRKFWAEEKRESREMWSVDGKTADDRLRGKLRR
jgi:hypothetical protein